MNRDIRENTAWKEAAEMVSGSDCGLEQSLVLDTEEWSV